MENNAHNDVQETAIVRAAVSVAGAATNLAGILVLAPITAAELVLLYPDFLSLEDREGASCLIVAKGAVLLVDPQVDEELLDFDFYTAGSGRTIVYNNPTLDGGWTHDDLNIIDIDTAHQYLAPIAKPKKEHRKGKRTAHQGSGQVADAFQRTGFDMMSILSGVAGDHGNVRDIKSMAEIDSRNNGIDHFNVPYSPNKHLTFTVDGDEKLPPKSVEREGIRYVGAGELSTLLASTNQRVFTMPMAIDQNTGKMINVKFACPAAAIAYIQLPNAARMKADGRSSEEIATVSALRDKVTHLHGSKLREFTSSEEVKKYQLKIAEIEGSEVLLAAAIWYSFANFEPGKYHKDHGFGDSELILSRLVAITQGGALQISSYTPEIDEQTGQGKAKNAYLGFQVSKVYQDLVASIKNIPDHKILDFLKTPFEQTLVFKNAVQREQNSHKRRAA